VEVLTAELAKPVVTAREELVRDLEQCFLCLYGHPSKKAKVRTQKFVFNFHPNLLIY